MTEENNEIAQNTGAEQQVPPSHYDWLAKIILLGDSGVGKTSVKTRLVDGQFREDAMMISTVGVDMSYKTFKVESDYIKVHIWDTAGQERYRSIAQSYYKGANGIVLVYAVDERQSLEHVDAWLKQILELAPANTKIMLLANKCDYDISKHFISTEQGQAVAAKYNIPYHEVSAKTGQNINESFQALFTSIREEFQRIERDEEIPRLSKAVTLTKTNTIQRTFNEENKKERNSCGQC